MVYNMDVLFHDNDVDGVLVSTIVNNRFVVGVFLNKSISDFTPLHREFTGKIITYDREYLVKNGVLHSFDDEPAFKNKMAGNSIALRWFWDGIPHRLTGPAVLLNNQTNGTRQIFYVEGKRYPLNVFLTLTSLSEEEKLDLVLKYG